MFSFPPIFFVQEMQNRVNIPPKNIYIFWVRPRPTNSHHNLKQKKKHNKIKPQPLKGSSVCQNGVKIWRVTSWVCPKWSEIWRVSNWVWLRYAEICKVKYLHVLNESMAAAHISPIPIFPSSTEHRKVLSQKSTAACPGSKCIHTQNTGQGCILGSSLLHPKHQHHQHRAVAFFPCLFELQF